MNVVFIPSQKIDDIHYDILTKTGGRLGYKDDLYKSVPTTVENLWYYENCRDIFVLAAKYAFCIVQYHSFTDGNKRTAFGVMIEFLEDNGYELDYDNDEMVDNIEKIASKKITFDEFVEYLKSCL
jgi:death-on-curing protein